MKKLDKYLIGVSIYITVLTVFFCICTWFQRPISSEFIISSFAIATGEYGLSAFIKSVKLKKMDMEEKKDEVIE